MQRSTNQVDSGWQPSLGSTGSSCVSGRRPRQVRPRVGRVIPAVPDLKALAARPAAAGYPLQSSLG
jgi:hypothetical protein